MCLNIKKNQKPRIAKRDITVYKTVDHDEDDTFRTVWYDAIVKIGEEYTSKLILQNDNISEIVTEALHSFSNLEEATADAEDDALVLIKCIIPKGSIYYKGRDCFNNQSYASNKLKYAKIIKDYPNYGI